MDTQDRIYSLWGIPVETGVQVKVGEGLTPGETWWVVAYKVPKDFRPWVKLSNQPGLPGERGQWFTVDYRFDNVHWDYGRLARAQSARAKALDCLENV